MQIDTDTSHDIFSRIQALDTGITNHEAWISQVNQSLICEHSHLNSDDLHEDAHCRCKFGRWLYSPETELLEDYELFHAVVEKHQQMHALARQILQKRVDGQSIIVDDYHDFTSQTMTFKLEVRNLQYMLMSEVCVVDHLTGAWNRYAMYSQLHQEKERLARTGNSCTICMMDLDYFKRINDDYGHRVGDQVLKTVVGFCSDSLRRYDSIYRYGGEEFLFCLPDAGQDEAQIIIERLCTSLGKHPVPLPNGETLSVTASFGISSLQNGTSVEDAIQEADHALLCAKAKGRDRVCCWEDGLSAFE